MNRISSSTLICVALLGLPTSPAHPDALKSMEIATNLGTVIAAEQYCGLQFDATAIESFIKNNVAADDLSFPSTLQMVVAGSKFQNKSKSASEKIAHCVQIKRIAKSHGFIK